MNSALIFGLLIALMLTGMPISISLGLTVLTYLFTMTNVPIESVALKLFTGIEKFEIMAIPFFILAGNFLTHGGVAKRMINFATSMVGHWHGGLGLAGVLACALFAAISGSSVATAACPSRGTEAAPGISAATCQSASSMKWTWTTVCRSASAAACRTTATGAGRASASPAA